jgi:hypothetical protein
MATKKTIEPKIPDTTMDLSEAGTKPCSPGVGDEQSENSMTTFQDDGNVYGLRTETQEQYGNGSSLAKTTSIADSCGTSELVEELEREHSKR